MSRLKKLAMDMIAFEGILNQTSNKGREILKSLEDFKFTLEQSARLLKNDQSITQGMIQKRKSLDEITAKLYQIVFDIENMDISEAFNKQNQTVVRDLPVNPELSNNEQNKQHEVNVQQPNIQPPSVQQEQPSAKAPEQINNENDK